MSIYDLTEELLKIIFENEPIKPVTQNKRMVRYLSMIEDDDNYNAERVRAIIQNHMNIIKEVGDIEDEDEDEDEDDRWGDTEDTEDTEDNLELTSNNILNPLDKLAVKIIEIYVDEIIYSPTLENIKNIVFDYLETEESDCTHEDQITIAHRILEIL